MRRVWCLLLVAFLPTAAVATEIELGGGVEYFQWEEFADNGNKLLSETGPRYFVEVRGTNRVERNWWLDFSARVYSGTVAYDGQTMSGMPVTTDTDYNGVRAEVGFNYFPGHSRIKPQGGDWLVRFAFGIDSWRRNLLDTALADGTPVSGYSERYLASYATVGTRYYATGGWSGGIGVKAPYYTSEEVSILSANLHPEGKLSLFADLEFKVAPRWSMALEYDSYRFAKSDVAGGFYQPQSSRDTLAAILRYHF